MSRTFFPFVGSTLTLKPIGYATYQASTLVNGSIQYVQSFSASGTYRLMFEANNTLYECRAPRQATNVQTFTSNGTWTRPTNGRITQFMIWGGGGGGGSANGATTGSRGAGGGAGPGSVSTQCFCLTQLLPATAAITVGSGGAGGLASSTTPGNAGSFGGASTVSFGAPIGSVVFGARGGSPGQAGSGGTTGSSSTNCFSDLPGGFITTNTNSGTLQTPGGGGRGASVTSLGSVTNASAGTSVGTGSITVPIAGGRGGFSNAGEAGANGSRVGINQFGGAGGAGGGGAQATLAGGAGGFPGGGGGGGGFRGSSQSARPGGTGGGGYVIAITW
jgi:hypothetical protein